MLPTLFLSILLGLSQAAPSGSHNPKPTVYTVSGATTYPEGVASQPNSPYFYTASTRTGVIYRGNLNSPTLEPFIDGPSVGNLTQGIGLKFLLPDKLLIAGGTSGTVFIYSVKTRKLLHRFSGGGFLNDLEVDGKSGDVYITDSTIPTLWKISGINLERGAVDQKLEAWLDLTRSVPYTGQFNGNGIAITPCGGYLIFSDFNDLTLYRIATKTRTIVPIEFNGAFIGYPDGLLYSTPYVYAINGLHENDPKTNYISVLKLQEPYTSGTAVGNITSSLFDEPSTAAFVSGSRNQELLVVNFQGRAATLNLPFSIVRVPVKW